MTQFEASTSVEPGRVVVHLAGEADLSVREELTDVLLAAVASSPVVVVDLNALTFLDSSGLHALITAYHAAKNARTQLSVADARGVVAQVLSVTGVADLLSVPSDVSTPSDV